MRLDDLDVPDARDLAEAFARAMDGFRDELAGARDVGREVLDYWGRVGLRPPVLGVGAALDPQGERLAPTLLVRADLAPAVLSAADRIDDAVKEIGDFLGGELPTGTLVIGIPDPVPFAGPGDAARCLARLGTLGPAVVRLGTDGLLTAGHFASPAGTLVLDGGSRRIGRVAFSLDPAALPGQCCADAAVIALDTPHGISGQVAGGADPGDLITSDGGVTVATEPVMGFMAAVYVPSMLGQWADVYMTTAPLSAPGDSGAPVTNANRETVGIVVGGAPGVTSFVQDIDRVLADTSSTLA